MDRNLPLARFRPRLLDACKGYTGERFAREAGAGATVGIVALPLGMAFAIASGLQPQAGLWTEIIAGLLISLPGGSHVQIGGPAGAFIVIIYGIVERYGLANLLICTACAGELLFAMGLLKLGSPPVSTHCASCLRRYACASTRCRRNPMHWCAARAWPPIWRATDAPLTHRPSPTVCWRSTIGGTD